MKQNQSSLSSKQYAVPFILITSLFFMWGFARAILDVLNKHFQNALDISITQSALIQVTTYLGYFLMAIPAGLFINRQGYRRGVVSGLLLFGLGSLAFIPCSMLGTFYAYLVALFIIGCGLVFLETSANPYVTELGPKETATSRLNFSQSFNGVGSMFATLVVGSFLFQGADGSAGGDAVIPYTIMGAFVLLIAVVFARVKLPEIVHDNDNDTKQGAHNLKMLFRNRWFVFGLLALLAYEVAEISINSYFINFVTGQGWMKAATGSTILTIGLGVFMLARFIGAAVMSNIAAEKYLAVCALGTVICILAAGIIAAFAEPIIGWFRADDQVIAIGRLALLYACAVMPFMAYSTFVNQLYQCLGYKLPATVLASLRQGICYLPLIFILPHFLGLQGVQMTQPGSDLLTFFICIPFQIVFFRKHLRDNA